MPRDSFVLYTSQYDAISDLSLKQKGELFDAIFSYVVNGQQPQLSDPSVAMAFRFISMQIDIDTEKYEKKILARSAAGKLGGRPRKAKKANAFSEKQKNLCLESGKTQKNVLEEKDKKNTEKGEFEDSSNHNTVSPETNENTSDNRRDKQKKQMLILKSKKSKQKHNDNVNVDVIYHVDNSLEPNGSEKNKEKKEKTRDLPASQKQEAWFKWCLNVFNAEMDNVAASIKRVRVISNSRREALRSLIGEYGDDFQKMWPVVCRNAARSDYLNGRTQRRKTPGQFDWIIINQNFVKLYENSI